MLDLIYMTFNFILEINPGWSVSTLVSFLFWSERLNVWSNKRFQDIDVKFY